MSTNGNGKSNGHAPNGNGRQQDKVRVAIIGVGNCANAFVQGVECKVGIANRAVRVVILSIGLLLADLGVLAPAVYVLAGLGTFTVLQRIFHVRRQLAASV